MIQPLATTARSGSDCNCASLLADLNLDNTSIGLLIALPTLRLTALPFLVEHDFTYDKTQDASV
jgi:hypothetical protein